MPSTLLTQLQDFLCLPEVIALYSSIRTLDHSKLEEALRIRGLSLDGDESIWRVKLLRFEVKFFHPEIDIPLQDEQSKLSKDEAANLQMRVDSLSDMVRTLCAESGIDAKTDDDAQVEESATLTDASVSIDCKHTNPVKYRLNCVKLLNACQLQYSGVKGLSARYFLESLNDFRIFSMFSEKELLETLPCVLDLDTKNWYCANNFADWQSFERKFVEDYVGLSKDVKPVIQQRMDRATQTDEETRNRKSNAPRMPVCKNLEDLRNSLADIGFKTVDSKKSIASSSQSSTASVSSEVKSTPQSPIDVAVENNTSTTLQSPMDNSIASIKVEVPMIVVNPAIRNQPNNTNEDVKPNLLIVKSEPVAVSQNNLVGQGQIACDSIAVDNASQIAQNLSSTNVTSGGEAAGCCLHTHHDCGPANLGQDYMTNQSLNYRFGAYHYPTEFYISNGFGHC